MTHTSSKKEELARNFENIILAWSSGISGEQHNKLPPEARELVSMLVSSSTRIIVQAIKELKEEMLKKYPYDPDSIDDEEELTDFEEYSSELSVAIDNKIKALEEV